MCCYGPDSVLQLLMPSLHRRHRQDKTVLSCPCRRCEQNWRQVKTVCDRKFRICFVQSQNVVSTIENSLDLLPVMVTPLTRQLRDILPPVLSQCHDMRHRAHSFVLPQCNSNLYKKSYINYCLFKDV